MTASQPWWAIPLFTLIGTISGVVLSQAGTVLNERLRRKAARAAQLDKDKAAAYLDYQRASLDLMHLRVWPIDPAGAQAPIEPPLTTLFQRNEHLTTLSHQRVGLAANEVAAKAHHLARTIREIRENTLRGPAGAIAEDAAPRFATSRRELAASLQRFVVTWRQDLGITAPYTAGLDADGSVLDPVPDSV